LRLSKPCKKEGKRKKLKRRVGWKGLENFPFCTLSLLPPQFISKPHNPTTFLVGKYDLAVKEGNIVIQLTDEKTPLTKK
jgi:hypothetical protein